MNFACSKKCISPISMYSWFTIKPLSPLLTGLKFDWKPKYLDFLILILQYLKKK